MSHLLDCKYRERLTAIVRQGEPPLSKQFVPRISRTTGERTVAHMASLHNKINSRQVITKQVHKVALTRAPKAAPVNVRPNLYMSSRLLQSTRACLETRLFLCLPTAPLRNPLFHHGPAGPERCEPLPAEVHVLQLQGASLETQQPVQLQHETPRTGVMTDTLTSRQLPLVQRGHRSSH